jgi:hypothetical protein
MGAGKNFLNWLQGTFGGNNSMPEIPELPMGVKAPKTVKKATTKKATPAKKSTPKKKDE